MRRQILALVLLLAGSIAGAAPGPPASTHVSIRATTAAITVTGGAERVSAKLYDAGGNALDGLAVEQAGARTHIILVASVKAGARIEVRVPTSTNLRVEAANGGRVIVRRVTGQHEIVNSNAGILLDDVAGTVLATTSNASIEATLLSVDPTLPLSFLTSNGAIDVTLPADVKANVRLESDTGPISTDFDLIRIEAQPIERRTMRGGRLRTIKYGAVNGGGPEIAARTENAPIAIRKSR